MPGPRSHWLMIAVAMSVATAGCDVPLCRALTRLQVFENVRAHVELPYTVTEDNVYPHMTCYKNAGLLGPTLAPGPREGVAYAYSCNASVEDFYIGLTLNGKGAGCHQDLWEYYGSDNGAPCIRDSITGIDCSAFASRAWGVSRRGTCTLIEELLKPTTLAKVLPGDALIACGVHVVLLASTVSGSVADWWEATPGDVGGCQKVAGGNLDHYYTEHGMRPYVFVKLKDDPAADVFALSAGPRDACLVVSWETLLERNTQAFVVERGQLPDGPFAAISGALAPRGQAGSGARYEFLDTSNPTGPVYYQLREIQTTGPDLLHGMVGPVTLSASGQEHQP